MTTVNDESDEIENEEEDASVVSDLEQFAADTADEASRIRAMAETEEDHGKLALLEISDTILPMMRDLAVHAANAASLVEELEDHVFGNPTQSALVGADAQLLQRALSKAYEFCKLVKNERVKNQDRVGETLEIVTELRVALQRATEISVAPDPEDEDPTRAMLNRVMDPGTEQAEEDEQAAAEEHTPPSE